MSPPTIEPPTPSRVVRTKPRCCAPGMMARAIHPTMKPTIMYQMKCNIGLFLLSRRGYHVGQIESDIFRTNLAGGLQIATPAKFSDRQRATSARASVRRLSLVITSFEAPFFRRVGRNPCCTVGVSLQEFCDLSFRQILAIHMRIAFRDAAVVGKDHKVEILTLVVEDGDTPVIAQMSLEEVAI